MLATPRVTKQLASAADAQQGGGPNLAALSSAVGKGGDKTGRFGVSGCSHVPYIFF